MDTMMYGFWGEGHTWPYEGNPFPSQLGLNEHGLPCSRCSLITRPESSSSTNTQPDFSNVGNAELLDGHHAHRQLVASADTHLYPEHANRGVEQPSLVGRGDL